MAPPANTYGDSGRGVLYAPGTQTVDVSLSRVFPIKAFRLQFRADAFNLFNTPQFGRPNGAFGNVQFGVIGSQANSPRQIQFGLKLRF